MPTNTVKRIEPQLNNVVSNINLHTTDMSIIDSGCTGNYLRDDVPVVSIDHTTPRITAGTPNGATITSSCSALLDNSAIPHHARKSTLFPGLTNLSLLSVGQFADAGYTT